MMGPRRSARNKKHVDNQDSEAEISETKENKTVDEGNNSNSSTENLNLHSKELNLSEDGNSSDSSVENYLKSSHEINLNSSFFNISKNETKIKQKRKISISNRLSDTSDSENDEPKFKSTTENNVEVKVKNETAFQSHHDFNKKIEDAKNAVENYNKKLQQEKSMDVKHLLSVGEKNDTTASFESYMSDSSTDNEMEWEQIEEKIKENEKIQTKDVQITVEIPTLQRKKKQKDDYIMQMKRRLNKIKKENQVYMHKVHLLCWIAHGNYINAMLNNENLLGLCLSLIPSENCYPPERADIKYLEMILRWYGRIIKLVEKPITKVPTLSLEKILTIQINKKQANSKKNYILLFILILRTLGLQCRLVLSLRCVPLRPPNEELCSLSTKPEQKKSDSKNKKVEPSTSSVKSENNKTHQKKVSEKDSRTSEKSSKGVEKDNKRDKKEEKTSKSKISDKKKTDNISKNKSSHKKSEKTEDNPSTSTKISDSRSRRNSSRKSSSDRKRETSSEKIEENASSSNKTSDSKTRKKSISKSEKNYVATKSNKKLSDTSSQKASNEPVPSTSRSKPSLNKLKRESNSEEDFYPRKNFSSPEKSFSSPEKSKTTVRNDVRNDIINLIKGSMSEQKIALRHRQSKPVDDSSDSDYQPEPTKKSKSDSGDEFRKKLVTTKVKQRIKPKSVLMKEAEMKNKKEVDPRVLSTDDEEDSKKKEKAGNDVWCEVFLEAEEKWISVDVIKSQVHCVAELHSRASTPVSYILSWNNNLSIKDITSRYCPHMNTVTRKLRIDPIWWRKTLQPYEGKKSSRDREEDEDLARQQLDQPLPKTIMEYKNHPLYALKRHLLKFEAIYPADALTLGFVRNEAVYARECVHTLHSREIWMKHAKVVKLGEKPYKIVKARPKYDRLTGNVVTDQPLDIFGVWQVEDYIPPTAKDGIVPRNAFGNVELFKPCMIPGGTVHLQLPGLNKVARKLQIDCAPALVGFDFHNGGTHPLFDGFIVCEEFREQLVKAWEEEQDEIARKEQEKIEKRVYDNWKKLIKGLLIREKLKAKYEFETLGSGKPKKKNKGPRFVSKKRRIISGSEDSSSKLESPLKKRRLMK